jgi:hypothetical protein
VSQKWKQGKKYQAERQTCKSFEISLSLSFSNAEPNRKFKWTRLETRVAHVCSAQRNPICSALYGWIWYLAMISQLVTRIQWNQAALSHLPASRLRELLDDDCDVRGTHCSLVISRVPRGVYRCFQFAQCTVFEQPNEQSRTEKMDGENSNRVELFILRVGSATQISTYERWLAAVSYTLLMPDNLLWICMYAAPADDDDEETFECVTCWISQVCQPTRFVFCLLVRVLIMGKCLQEVLSANRPQIFLGVKDSVERRRFLSKETNFLFRVILAGVETSRGCIEQIWDKNSLVKIKSPS